MRQRAPQRHGQEAAACQQCQQQGDRRRQAARERQCAQRQADQHGIARTGRLDVAHRAVHEEGDQRPLQGDGQRLVAEHQQTQAAQVHQHGGVGQGAAVVVGFGLAAEGQAQRLGFRAAAQVEHGVPDRHGADHKDADVGHAGRHRAAHQPAEQLDAQRAEPERERAFVGQRQAGDIGRQPVVHTALRHAPHDAEARCVFLPQVASDQAWQDVQQAQSKQGPARQGEGGGGGETDWFHQ